MYMYMYMRVDIYIYIYTHNNDNMALRTEGHEGDGRDDVRHTQGAA